MNKGKWLRSVVVGQPSSSDPQLLRPKDAQVGNDTAVRICHGFQVGFLNTPGCFGRCFPMCQPDVLVSLAAE